MSRPEFPTGIALSANCISRIREEQEYYDQDPERAEREQLEREEEKTMEQHREAEYQQQCQEDYQNWQDEILITEPETKIEDLPF